MAVMVAGVAPPTRLWVMHAIKVMPGTAIVDKEFCLGVLRPATFSPGTDGVAGPVEEAVAAFPVFVEDPSLADTGGVMPPPLRIPDDVEDFGVFMLPFEEVRREPRVGVPGMAEDP